MNNISDKSGFNNIIRLVFFLVILFLISPNQIFSQTDKYKDNPPAPTSHNEVKDDDYIPDLRDSQGRSPGYNYSMTFHIINPGSLSGR